MELKEFSLAIMVPEPLYHLYLYFFNILGAFKAIIPLGLVGYEMHRVSLVIYHLLSKVNNS